jgi:Fe2+ transport system protein B
VMESLKLNSMQVSLNVSDELATQLQRHDEAQLSKIFELGIRKLNAQEQLEFEGISEILEFLASLPTPEEIIALRPSESFQARISALLEKNRTEGLTPDEEQEWEQYEYLEHLVRLAKAKAHLKLQAQ